MDIAAFSRWLRAAQPGERVVYFMGAGFPDGSEARVVGNLAWAAYQAGLVELVRRPVAGSVLRPSEAVKDDKGRWKMRHFYREFEYLAQRCGGQVMGGVSEAARNATIDGVIEEVGNGRGL